MTTKIKNWLTVMAMVAAVSNSSCALDEYNPSGYTMDALSNSVEGYQTILNNIYFGMERAMYGDGQFMWMTEGGTDIWTSQKNADNLWLRYGMGSDFANNMTSGLLNAAYDGVCYCNLAIVQAEKTPFASDEERKQKVAEAYFMRAVYYYNMVEQLGGVKLQMAPVDNVDIHPGKDSPMDIYEKCIIPDLEFAAQWLPVEDRTTRPSKKSAMGMLARACLQSVEYDSSKKYVQRALEVAPEMINACKAGGAALGVYMYDNVEDVFDENNNFENKEALWKHRWYAGSDGHGSSNGNYKLNRNDEYFLCNVNKFGAREDNQETRLTWEGCISGIFMPTQHLLNLYVQEDGTLDPRFHESFTTEWNANKNYIWDTSAANMYDKDESIVGTELKKGDLAIKFVMPQDEDYAEEKANRHTSNYLMIAYDDVYNDQKHNVNMQYNGMENQFRYFYPSLNKHNSSNYYVANASKKRNGNLNATFMMRMAEVYLIAAEADIYINGGANAMGYINKVRARAGAKALTGTATVRTVLDERGRELCGEYCRFYDLKRTGMFKSSNYLEETHPDLAQFFNPNYALRPISTTFTATISNGAEYQNPGY